ncbi:MAG: glycyl-radical enzyme activating protein [Acidobacteria bacterium]|nr:glycyl-radical enzyme activating protein [Acidobacteriota bacterium]
MKGRIFDLQRFSIHDGPGIRTTVFFKGCPLRCLWCHNPEGIDPKPQLAFTPEKCIGCGECVQACPETALARNQAGRAVLDRARCNACGACAPACDTQALEMVGRDVSVEEVRAVVLRDRDYYSASGGGLTLSGGEPLAQPEFAEALLGAAQAERLHCVVETSGFAEWKLLERLLPLVDLWLYDYKETNPQLHASFTGESNQRILENLRALDRAGARLALRCPMVPEYNARKEHLDGIAALAGQLRNLAGVELLPYHRLGQSKLRRFGFTTRMPATVKPPDQTMIGAWNAHLRSRGVRLVGPLAPSAP